MIDKRLLIMVAPLALAACGKSDAAPSGQVAATVNGQEITTTDIETELNGAVAGSAEGQKNLQRMALEQIINRTLLAQEAVNEGLDKSPEYAVLERKAKQAALIELLQRKMAKGVVKPSDEEAEAFISNNPTMFANRTIYVVDQMVVAKADKALAEALMPVKTMAEASAVLAQRGIKANQTVGVIDSLTIPVQAAQQITNLPPNEVFIIPSNGGMRINYIRSQQVNPVAGEEAKNIAREMLQRQRTEQSLQATAASKLKKARESVKYNAAFAPPPAAKAPAGGAPAAK